MITVSKLPRAVAGQARIPVAMDQISMQLGDAIYTRCRELNWTLADLIWACGLGQEAVMNLYHATGRATLEEAVIVAFVLDLDVGLRELFVEQPVQA